MTEAITTGAGKDITVDAGTANVKTTITASGASTVTLKGIPQVDTAVTTTGAGTITYNTKIMVGPAADNPTFIVAVGDAAKVVKMETAVAGKPVLTIDNAEANAITMETLETYEIPQGLTVKINQKLTVTTGILTLKGGAVLEVTGKVTLAALEELVGTVVSDSPVLAASKLILTAGLETKVGEVLVTDGGNYKWVVSAWAAE